MARKIIGVGLIIVPLLALPQGTLSPLRYSRCIYPRGCDGKKHNQPSLYWL